MIRSASLLALGLMAALPAWAQNPSAADAAVARVNGTPITEVAFLRALAQATATGAPDSPELRNLVRSQLIARELFLQEARKQKVAEDAKVKEAVTEARDNARVQVFLQRAVKARPIADEDVRKQYDIVKAGLGDFEYKPRVMLVQDEATARGVIVQLRTGGSFDAMARLYSSAPSAARGGELDWVSFKTPPAAGKTQGIPLAVAQAMIKLKKGMLSADPIEASGRWYIVQMDDIRPAVVPDYESVKPMLRRMLEAREVERAAESLIKDLLAKAKVE
jgi:parvulin-like peptidyl-prolyl isomerase